MKSPHTTQVYTEGITRGQLLFIFFYLIDTTRIPQVLFGVIHILIKEAYTDIIIIYHWVFSRSKDIDTTRSLAR